MISMKKKDLYFVLPAFLVALVVGYSLNSTLTGEEEFDQQFDAEVNATNPVQAVEFDDREITLMHQNDPEARFFMDITGDGSSDRELEVRRDGRVHQDTVLATVEGKTYFLYLRYSDDPDAEGDGWMTLYRVRAA
jgi:hypothetical protein